MSEWMSCACGRPFIPDVDLYHAHVQTPEHQRWRIETIERGRTMTTKEAMAELYGMWLPNEGAEPVDTREFLPSPFRVVTGTSDGHGHTSASANGKGG